MHMRYKSRRGQTMVEYIIIVLLIAITLLVFFGKLSKATGKKVAGATAALDEDVGSEAADLVDEEPADKLRRLDETGNFN
jgi:competence protein ComGC